MSRQKSESELIHHKKQAINTLENYLDQLILSEDSKQMGKADKLSYWLNDWTNYLKHESEFSPMSIRRYKRGEIIKVHLGFNVGSEEGGLHYAVVLDKKNARTSPVVTIIPLTSIKPNTNISNLKDGRIFLGNELFTNLSSKFSSVRKQVIDELNLITPIINELAHGNTSNTQSVDELKFKVNELKCKLQLLERMKREIQNMKTGSIALVTQITTVSKMRIYDPKKDGDILSGIKLSNEKLDLIDSEIKKLFTNI